MVGGSWCWMRKYLTYILQVNVTSKVSVRKSKTNKNGGMVPCFNCHTILEFTEC